MLSRRRVLAAGGALPLAAGLAGCGVIARSHDGAPTASAVSRPASDAHQWARTAWRYVENNTDYDTGLVGGMDRVPVFTAANLADALAAIACAHDLGVIDAREFDLRLSRVLGFLGTLDLSGGQLPNKAYHAASGKMVGFDGREADIGWSAIDIGRLLLWLRIVAGRHARFAEYADQAVLRWSFCDAIDDCGTLHGTARSGAGVQRYQEGRLGYEQLAAAGFAAWGFDTRDASSWSNSVVANVEGVPVRHDARDPRTTGASDAVLTMPYALMGIELGWQLPGGGAEARTQAEAVFNAQQARWRREGVLTARSDYQSREAPYVVLDAVFADGYPWNTVAADGKEYPRLALVSTRAVFAMAALWPGDYAQRLRDDVRWLYDPDRGWFEGRYEAGGGPMANITLATNAAILEALQFQAKGPLFTPTAAPAGLFEKRTRDVFQQLKRCTPAERAACRK